MAILYAPNMTKCDSCGHTNNTFAIIVENSEWGQSKRITLCENCRRELYEGLQKSVKIDEPNAPHGGKWFQIWKEDIEGMLATMYKNLSADLEAGYSYSGKAIQSQLQAIDEYKQSYDENLDKFVYMSDGEVSRWCYYDLKKRGAIE